MNSEIKCTFCGREIKEEKLVTHKIRGTVYNFCSDECRIVFDRTQGLPYLYCTLISLLLVLIGFPVVQLFILGASIEVLIPYFRIFPVFILALIMTGIIIRRTTARADERRQILQNDRLTTQ